MLSDVAKSMRRDLAHKSGATKRILFGGLVVVMERDGDAWRCAIGRDGAPPSRTEADVIARDFGLPAGVEWAWTTKEQRRCVHGRRSVQVYITKWNVAECRWIERQPEIVSQD